MRRHCGQAVHSAFFIGLAIRFQIVDVEKPGQQQVLTHASKDDKQSAVLQTKLTDSDEKEVEWLLQGSSKFYKLYFVKK